ncbi:expressed unknown protein [Seminavis robusta]|uniref:Calmodulin n=1 Tax=Seminavis robusta TaxID=568900 RepID=A0A9N8EBP1_9STRA|nr:expressed unknown protein [Seminavis robusta]|eukprot:Sro911_g219220.1 n/a (199) ;mRNA; f:18714-19430
MKINSIQRALVLLLAFSSVQGQQYDYEDYGDDQGQDYYAQTEDTLYQDYAEHQQMKAQGGGGAMVKMFGAGVAGWFLGGKIHSKRALKKQHKKHIEDLKDLYSKYINDVSTQQSQIAELEAFIKESARQQLADEFLRADYDNNRQVSRAEFERYKREYLIKHPEMTSAFPEFEAFDPDRNGMITLREHEEYYEQRGMI